VGAGELGFGMSIFRTDPPAYDDILAVRADHQHMVTDFLTSATPDLLAEARDDPWGRGDRRLSVGDCIRVIREEEWAHLRYIRRDLALLKCETGNGGNRSAASASADTGDGDPEQSRSRGPTDNAEDLVEPGPRHRRTGVDLISDCRAALQRPPVGARAHGGNREPPHHRPRLSIAQTGPDRPTKMDWTLDLALKTPSQDSR
jgi:DinB family protein